MSDFRYPFITEKDPAKQLKQIESYLHQLVDKLNTESRSSTGQDVLGKATASVQKKPNGQYKTPAEATFDEIKSLIIKSADIVDALYETYTKRLDGHYVSQSEYGVFVEQSMAEMKASADRISTTLQKIESLDAADSEFQSMTRKNMSQLAQQAENIQISVTSILTNGVDKVKTQMGYTFDDEGLRIQRAGAAIENLLDNTGMYVTRSGETILQANADGVVATDVTVRNYLVIGNHARFENYNDGSGAGRTACFYVG